MSKPTTDHERYCAATQAFFDDIDRDGPEVVDIGASAEFDAEYDAPLGPDPEPAGDSIDAGDSVEQLGGRRLIDDEPIDLDGPGPADEQPRTVGADMSTGQCDSAENPQPGSDLVDQLTSAAAAGDDTGGAGECKRAAGPS